MTTDRRLIDDFLGGATDGRGQRLRIDGNQLAAEMPLPPDWTLALRIEPEVYLLRDAGPDDDTHSLRDEIVERLRGRGLEPVTVDHDGFVEVAATIIAAIRTPDWRVWAPDAERGCGAVDRVLIGEPVVELESPDAGPGMTLDDLLGDLNDLDRRLDAIARHAEGGEDEDRL